MKVNVTNYADLEKWVGAFKADRLQLLLVTGTAGLQKSTTVRCAIDRDYARWFEGTLSAFRLYLDLYTYRDRPIVIDDVDSLYSDKSSVRLLKTLCQTEEVKHVAWHSQSAWLEKTGTPNEFTTTSRVVIIANEWNSLNANVGAIEDRGLHLNFTPTAAEVHSRVKKWFKDQEVYEWIGTQLPIINLPSMRQYVVASEVKKAGLDWKDALYQTWGVDADVRAYLEISADKQYKTEAARQVEFTKRGHGSRATYFRIKQKFA